MAHDQQPIEQPERDGRHHEKVHRRDAVSMVAKERLPSREEGRLLRAIYLATLVWPTSMPSLRSSPWILGAPHSGLAMLISRISRRISSGTVGRPQWRRDFQRQYNLKPARCQRITVSGRQLQVPHTSWEIAGRYLPISVCQSMQIEASWDWHAAAH